MRSILYFFLLTGIAVITTGVQAQEQLDTWQHQGGNDTFPTGIRSGEWYAMKSKTSSKKIIVAVLDSGIDIHHPDLTDNIWVNPGEIPGNGIDDDQNGYTDDLHGWNFLGGPNGESVIHESLEVTREYAKERSIWEDADVGKLKGKKKKAYVAYLEKKDLIETRRAGAEKQLAEMQVTSELVMGALYAAKEELNGDSLDVGRLENATREEVQIAASIIQNVQEQGIEVESIDWLIEIAEMQFEEMILPYEEDLQYTYNPDYDARKIIEEDYFDFSKNNYGNNQVDGDFAVHGTHVAGIIAATRHNDLGMDGVADNVAIMCLKVVPNGDERDKDVANAIRYAVDNGALVVNMSFGKGYSPEKFLVDDAMKYAAKHDVLLVVGAGNESTNIDEEPKFPNDLYRKKPLFGSKRAKNFLSIGALSPEGGKEAVAEFSNYGREDVDIFAPGVFIYSTTPDSTYEFLSGTSMAAPVVSGMAALIRSRYPDLSALQVKEIIMESSRKLPTKLIQPGTFDEVSAEDLCVSAGMADVVRAMQLAAKTKGKAKLKKRKEKSLYPGKKTRT